MSDFTFPLSPATVQNGSITVDMFVKEPTRISRYVSDIVQANLVSQFLFTTVGATGGAILFDRLEKNDALANQNPGVIAPGAEFPSMDAGRSEPIVERVVKTGGKYEVTREAQIRNNPTLLQRGAGRVANTMVVDIDTRAFNALSATLDSFDGALSVRSSGWGSAAKVANSAKTAVTGDGQIVSDLLDAQALIDETRLGYKADSLILNPKDSVTLKKVFGIKMWREILNDMELKLYKTSAVKPGEGFVLQSRAAGVMGVEDPISTDNGYIKSRQVTEFYTWVTMAFGITDPLSIVKLSNLGA